MNRDERFENRLVRVPQTPVPPAWREEILTAARSAATPRAVRPPAHTSIRDALWALLWPHPRAWAGLAAAWVLILGLTLAGRDSRDSAQTEMVRQARPPSPELRELLRQQGKLFAELTGRADDARPAPVRPTATEPRSQRREEALNA